MGLYYEKEPNTQFQEEVERIITKYASVKICSQFGLKKSLNLKLSFAPYPIQFFVLKVYYHLCSIYLKNDLQSIQPN